MLKWHFCAYTASLLHICCPQQILILCIAPITPLINGKIPVWHWPVAIRGKPVLCTSSGHRQAQPVTQQTLFGRLGQQADCRRAATLVHESINPRQTNLPLNNGDGIALCISQPYRWRPAIAGCRIVKSSSDLLRHQRLAAFGTSVSPVSFVRRWLLTVWFEF